MVGNTPVVRCAGNDNHIFILWISSFPWVWPHCNWFHSGFLLGCLRWWVRLSYCWSFTCFFWLVGKVLNMEVNPTVLNTIHWTSCLQCELMIQKIAKYKSCAKAWTNRQNRLVPDVFGGYKSVSVSLWCSARYLFTTFWLLWCRRTCRLCKNKLTFGEFKVFTLCMGKIK